ncbi:MAG: hypothetical protein CL927_11565 [Deltaproteobacteria bacterium]|nr:hypothetical protein [Deltaproteobacteria bacterium]
MNALEDRWPRWATPLLFFVLAVIWTWPAVLGQQIVGHHPDAPGTAWFLSAASRLGSGVLHDPMSGWPVGATYGRPDSFLLIPFGWLGAPLGSVRLLGWLAVLGVTVSAWATESLARQLGARAPWSLLAGLTFAFSGLAATAQLEGYPYHLLDPWVPLFLGAWLRATTPGGRPVDGALAGLWFVLALLDTAWLGIVCVPLGLALAVVALTQRDRGWLRNAGAALWVAAPAFLVYLWAFRVGGGDGSTALADAGFPVPDLGQTLRRMAPPSPSIDLHGYTQSATLPAVALALTMVARRWIAREVPWRRLVGAGMLCLALALAPAVLLPLAGQVAHLGGQALSVVASAVLGIPDRLTWGSLVCFGVVGAAALSGMAGRHPRAALVVLALAMVDAFVVPRMPVRQKRMLAAVPSAYSAHTGPVLDVWPDDASDAPAWGLWTTNFDCYYQSGHGRPIADLCIVSPGVTSPRRVLEAWVLDLWLRGAASETVPLLQSLGFGSLAFHTGVMHDSDRARILSSAEQWSEAMVHSTDGGEEIVAVGIPDAGSVSVAARAEAWNRFLESDTPVPSAAE